MRCELGRLRLRRLQIVDEPVVAERERDPRLADRIGQLARPQHRHGRDHDAARLEHREIGGDHHRRVGGAQQHAVAGLEAEIARSAHWRCGSPARRARHSSSSQAGGDDRGALAAALRDMAVEQFGDGVQPLGIGRARPLPAADRASFRAAADCPARSCLHAPTARICGVPSHSPAFWLVSSAGRARSRSSGPRWRPRRCAAP